MKTPAERQKEWRERKEVEGFKMITIWLEPDVAKALSKASIESDTPFADRQKLINLALRELLDVHP